MKSSSAFLSTVTALALFTGLGPVNSTVSALAQTTPQADTSTQQGLVADLRRMRNRWR